MDGWKTNFLSFWEGFLAGAILGFREGNSGGLLQQGLKGIVTKPGRWYCSYIIDSLLLSLRLSYSHQKEYHETNVHVDLAKKQLRDSNKHPIAST